MFRLKSIHSEKYFSYITNSTRSNRLGKRHTHTPSAQQNREFYLLFYFLCWIWTVSREIHYVAQYFKFKAINSYEIELFFITMQFTFAKNSEKCMQLLFAWIWNNTLLMKCTESSKKEISPSWNQTDEQITIRSLRWNGNDLRRKQTKNHQTEWKA